MKEIYEGQERRTQAWHLSRTVPITLIIALIAQTIALIIWAVRLEGRVDQTEISGIESRKLLNDMEIRERDGGKLSERVVRVETILESVQRTVNRIEATMDIQSKERRNSR